MPLRGLDYFDNSASQYAERSASTLWRWQRNRELAVVRTLLENVEGLNVLDLGCGAGFYTRYCIQQGAHKVIAVDFSPLMIEQLPKENVEGIVANATEVKLDEQVPKIICAGLLEFVSNPQDVLTNAQDLVTPDGIMVCLVPPENLAGSIYQKFHRHNGVNISLFSEAAFGELAHRAGWRIDEHKFVFPYSSVYRLKVM